MINKPKTEYINVEFYEADSGWLRYKVSNGQQVFHDSFSHVFDPLSDFKSWLEAISIGVQQTSFQYDNEGEDIKFDFQKISWDREVFTLSEAYENGEVFLTSNIDRRQLVEAFYIGLLTFASSDKYNAIHWEIESITERLCKLHKIKNENLSNELFNLNKIELELVLNNASLVSPESFTFEKDINGRFKSFDKLILNKDEWEWEVPNEYDLWEKDRKQQFIQECLKESVSPYDGMKLNDFHSIIIENFIKKE